MLGNFPFFFIIMVIANKAKLIAIINNVNSKVVNISIIFVKQYIMLQGDRMLRFEAPQVCFPCNAVRR